MAGFSVGRAAGAGLDGAGGGSASAIGSGAGSTYNGISTGISVRAGGVGMASAVTIGTTGAFFAHADTLTTVSVARARREARFTPPL